MKLPLLQLVQQQPALARSVALAGGGLLMGQWVLSDVLHIPGGGLGLLAAGAGVLWLGRRTKPPTFEAPASLTATRCLIVSLRYSTRFVPLVRRTGSVSAVSDVVDR